MDQKAKENVLQIQKELSQIRESQAVANKSVSRTILNLSRVIFYVANYEICRNYTCSISSLHALFIRVYWYIGYNLQYYTIATMDKLETSLQFVLGTL